MVQAKQVAYHDRDQHIADPLFADVPTERLISKAYANERRGLMDPARALPWDKIPSYGSLAGDTVYVAAVDKEGNAASLIQSLYGSFGAAVVAGRTGVVLQNRSAYFSLDPKSPNKVEPGKTPLHTLIASLAYRDDKLWAAVGCMGADGQPQIHLQTYVAHDRLRPRHPGGARDAALPERPLRASARRATRCTSRRACPPRTIDALERRGHLLNRWGDWNEYAGHAHGIVIDPDERPQDRRLRPAERRRRDRVLARSCFSSKRAWRESTQSPLGCGPVGYRWHKGFGPTVHESTDTPP